MRFAEPRQLLPEPRTEREPERDLVDEVMHFHRCCECKKNCRLTENPRWPAMRVSACCLATPYRCEYTEFELAQMAREALEDGDTDRAELLIHAAGRVRKEYRAERERRRA